MIVKHKKQLFLFELRNTKQGEEVELRFYRTEYEYSTFIIPYWAWKVVKEKIGQEAFKTDLHTFDGLIASETNPNT